MSHPKGFSSQSYTPGTAPPTKSLPTNKKVDQTGKSKEKDDMVGLNDKFVMLIDKVKHLEDENKKLETKLKILKGKEDYDGKINNIVKEPESKLKEQLENLLHDRQKLRDELLKCKNEVMDTKKRYEDEIQKKGDLENAFIIRKKDADEGQLDAVDLALELEDLLGELAFLRGGYDEEIKELESQVQNETVILKDNSKRSLDIDDMIEDAKNQYAQMAARTREEAEQWNQSKMKAMVLNAGQREQEVRDVRREISDLVRLIQRLRGEKEALERKEDSLKNDINDVRTEGEGNVENARDHISQLEAALRRTRQDLAGQIREHQELMNLKLALDIEIATYRKLLEGEEQRMNATMRHVDDHLPLKQHPPKKPQAPEPTVIPESTFIPPNAIILPVCASSKKRLLIRVEVIEGRVVSESSHYTED